MDFGAWVGNNPGQVNLAIQATTRLAVDAMGWEGIGTTGPREMIYFTTGTLCIPFLAGTGYRMVMVNSLGHLLAGVLPGGIVIPFNGFVQKD